MLCGQNVKSRVPLFVQFVNQSIFVVGRTTPTVVRTTSPIFGSDTDIASAAFVEEAVYGGHA